MDDCETCKFKTCICQPFWKDIERLLNETVFVKEDYQTSPIFISTITLNYEIDSNIDLEKFVEYCKNIKNINDINFTKGGRKSKTEETNNYLYNQCQLTFDNKPITILVKEKKQFKFTEQEIIPKIKVSIFKNGSIKIVGFRNVKQIRRTIHILQKIFMAYPDCLHTNRSIKIDGKKVTQKGLKRRNNNKIEIKNARMSMINSTFYVDSIINRANLYNYLINMNNPNIKQVTFDPEKHVAVRIKFLTRESTKVTVTRKKTLKQDGEITLMVFNTGPVIINGAQSIYDIVNGYNFINNILYNNIDLRT